MVFTRKGKQKFYSINSLQFSWGNLCSTQQPVVITSEVHSAKQKPKVVAAVVTTVSYKIRSLLAMNVENVRGNKHGTNCDIENKKLSYRRDSARCGCRSPYNLSL